MHLSSFRLQALEKEVADLAASLDDISAAAVALKGNILRLSVPAEQPPPVQLSDDEYELQESSEVSLAFWECPPADLTCLFLPHRLHLPQAMQGDGESPHLEWLRAGGAVRQQRHQC